MNAAQRTSITTVLECQALDHSWRHLKKASIKLFCLYGSSSSSGFSKGSHTVRQAGTQEGSEVPLAGDDQVFIIRRGKGKGGRNRPNMEQMAIRRTQDAVNLKNRISAFGSAGEGAKG